MKVIKKTDLVYFDVDDTLVMYDDDVYDLTYNRDDRVEIDSIVKSNKLSLKKNIAHIELLKTFKRRGKTIVVWSHGGWQWANEVVEHLGLEEFVDIIIEKPAKMVDDKPVERLSPRIYLNYEGGEE